MCKIVALETAPASNVDYRSTNAAPLHAPDSLISISDDFTLMWTYLITEPFSTISPSLTWLDMTKISPFSELNRVRVDTNPTRSPDPQLELEFKDKTTASKTKRWAYDNLAGVNVPLNQWRNLIVTFDGSDTQTPKVWDYPVGQTGWDHHVTDKNDDDTIEIVDLGRRMLVAVPDGIDGRFWQWKVWSKALTQDEVVFIGDNPHHDFTVDEEAYVSSDSMHHWYNFLDPADMGADRAVTASGRLNLNDPDLNFPASRFFIHAPGLTGDVLETGLPDDLTDSESVFYDQSVEGTGVEGLETISGFERKWQDSVSVLLRLKFNAVPDENTEPAIFEISESRETSQTRNKLVCQWRADAVEGGTLGFVMSDNVGVVVQSGSWFDWDTSSLVGNWIDVFFTWDGTTQKAWTGIKDAYTNLAAADFTEGGDPTKDLGGFTDFVLFHGDAATDDMQLTLYEYALWARELSSDEWSFINSNPNLDLSIAPGILVDPPEVLVRFRSSTAEVFGSNSGYGFPFDMTEGGSLQESDQVTDKPE